MDYHKRQAVCTLSLSLSRESSGGKKILKAIRSSSRTTSSKKHLLCLCSDTLSCRGRGDEYTAFG